MSSSEREYLQRALGAAGDRSRLWRIVGSIVAHFASALLALVIAWVLVAGPVRIAFGVNYGWDSPIAIWVMLIGIPVCAVFAIVATIQWVRRWPDNRAALVADLERGVVVEELYRFVAVKRFQEPEHGGLIYFLRTDDHKTLVLYDHESQDLGVNGKDPQASSFLPRSELIMVRAPATRLVIDKRFGGNVMEVGAPAELGAPPREWPESEDICDIPWDDLERRLGARR